MPRIAGVSIATPDNTVSQSDIKSFAASIFSEQPSIDRLLPVFDNALIEKRHFITDLDWFNSSHTFTEVNNLYISSALDLSEKVVCGLADEFGIPTDSYDAVFFVSTTGLSTPSIDARLFNRIRLNRHIKRIPIWGLGCAGGAGGVARAYDYAKAYPKSRVLVIAVELCGLAFQRNELSKSNVIAAALFGDGAAACAIVGDEVDVPSSGISHPEILGSLSTTYDDTLDVMGWNITSDGFKVVLSRDIPTIVTGLVKENINELLTSHGLSFTDIKHYVAHPGGRKVLEAYCEALGIGDEELKHSMGVLRDNGNMSSATVFFILRRFLEQVRDGDGSYGLLSALGPGFSSELVLLRW